MNGKKVVCVHVSVTAPLQRREASLHTFEQTLRPTAWDPVVTNVKRVLVLLVIRTGSENEHCFRM